MVKCTPEMRSNTLYFMSLLVLIVLCWKFIILSFFEKNRRSFYVKQHIVLFQGTFFSKTSDFFSEMSDFFSKTWDVFLDLYGIVRKRSLKFVWGCAVGERWCVINCEYCHSFSLSHAQAY